MLKRVLAAAAVACCAVPALAADAPDKAAPKEKRVCSYESSTGSHLKRRVCVSESEHQARRERDQQRMREMQTRQVSPNPDQAR